MYAFTNKFGGRRWNLCGCSHLFRLRSLSRNVGLISKVFHSTWLQGIYTFDLDTPAIQVDTFCVHGGPTGYITGIRGRVQCLSEEEKDKNETGLERQEMIMEKCYLRFPTLPFIPKEPYDVIATDYDNYALVSGAKDRSFIQVNLFCISAYFSFLRASCYYLPITNDNVSDILEDTQPRTRIHREVQILFSRFWIWS